jgi:DNA-directed RNA polymerase subunit RPC12/RpoP
MIDRENSKMPSRFLTFHCASCGARLELEESEDRLPCGVCGGKMLVQRPGVPIRAHLAGAEPVPPEMAIRQYESDIRELRASETAIGSKHFAPVRGTMVCGGATLLAGAVVSAAVLLHPDGFANSGPLGVVLVLLGGYVFLFGYRNSNRDSAQLRDVREQIAELERLIDRQKQIAGLKTGAGSGSDELLAG